MAAPHSPMDRPDEIDLAVDPTAIVIETVDEEADAMEAVVSGEEIQTEAEQLATSRQAALDAIKTAVLQQRDAALRGRATSGIEQTWLDDLEMYEGIDDANRAEEAWARQSKPFQLTIATEPTSGGGQQQTKRSNVLLNIARPYCDSASARVGDMLLPTDDRPWSFGPTPEAEIEGFPLTSAAPVAQAVAGTAGIPLAVAAPVAAPLPDADAQRASVQAEARRFAERCQRKVDDWLTQCDWHGQVRQIIDDCARVGTGVLKGPVGKSRPKATWRAGNDGVRRMARRYVVEPVSEAISVWDCFPDPACGENIHDGGHFHERMRWTEKVLADLREAPPEAGWLVDQINECLREGPMAHTFADGDLRNLTLIESESSLYECWNSFITLRREDMQAAGCNCDDIDETTFLSAHAVVCNDRVIKVTINALDSGEFPYDFFTWSRREAMPYGRGICRQIRTPQRIITAAVRNLMDNAGLSSGVMLFLRRKGLVPADGSWTLHGRKVFYMDEDAKAEEAVKAVEVPSRQQELVAIIDFALRMAEDVTGMPMLMQGQQGQAPDTVGGMQLLNNNANATLRRLAKRFDTQITEPHITRYYEWMQLHVDDPQYHGDLRIDARGSSALVERDIQNQAVGMMAQYVSDPEFRVNKSKWFEEWCKSQRLDAKRFQYTDDEWKEIQANQPPPPADPRIEAAKIREAGQTERQQAELAARREEHLMELLAEEGLSTAEFKTRLLDIVTKDRRERDLFTAQRAVKEQYGESVDMPG